MPRPERSLDPDAGPVEALAAELRSLRRHAGNPGYRVLAGRSGYSVTALANAASGRQLPSLPVTLAFVRACGGDPVEWERRWRQVAADFAAQRAPRGAAGTSTDDPPYRGLAGYGVDDGAWFFGRRRLVAQLVEMLSRQRFVAVFGASGSGKSSLVRAGLIPAMTTAERGDGGFRVELITPGSDPMVSLRRVQTSTPPGPDVLLVVDQFEELFTLCRVPSERMEFVAGLAALVNNESGTRVVIAVRADFYARCAELPILAGLLAGANVPVGPLSAEQLREVITEPARRAGLSVERALVIKILADAADQPGALPLVSHALQEMWRQRRGDVLTMAGYESAGGVAGAIAQTAETVYQGLDGRQQQTTQHVLSRLVTLGEGVEDTRRRIDRAELDLPDAELVLRELAAARLIVVGRDTVEIAHEALIRAWPRLHEWLHADRETLRLHQQLTEASKIWDSLNGDPGALYRGARLAEWDGRSTQRLNGLERRFLAASRKREEREAAARRRRVTLTVSSLTAGLVVMVVLAALALYQARRADDQRDLALSRQLVANARAQLQVDQEVALLLAMQAYDTKPTEEAQAVLRQALVDSRVRAVLPSGQGRVFGVAYSPDGRRLASSGGDGAVRIWDRIGADRWRAARVLRGHVGDVWSPVFSRDGRWLAACGVDGAVTVWDLSRDTSPEVLRGHRGVVSGVSFSPDGMRVAGAGGDGTVRVWDRSGARAPVVHKVRGAALGVAFSPDGRHLAASGDGSIWIWNADGTDAPRILTGHEGPVESIAFSPDGRRLASAGVDGTARVWPVGGGGAPLVLRGNDGVVETVAFSPDGRRLASGHSDTDTIRVWNTTTADDPLLLRGHDAPVWSVAFSPDGQRIASASSDGTIRFWDPAYPGGPTVRYGHDGAVYGLAVSRDGRRIASGGVDGTVRIWDPTSAAHPLVLRGHEGEVLDVAFSPDNRHVASAGRDHTVRIWDAVGTAPPAVLRRHEGAVLAVDFGPDGRLLASAGGDGTVRIWDTAGRRELTVLRGHKDLARDVAFSPDGSQVASTDNGGIVRVWNTTGRDDPLILSGHPVALVWTVDFSPDGRRVVSGGQEGSLRLWNTDGRGEPLVLRGQEGAVWSIGFSPDGRLLVSVGDIGGGLRIWHARSGAELISYRGHGAVIEQATFTADGQRLITVHSDGTLRTWSCEVCHSIQLVRALAPTRTTRTLTAEERTAFLNEPTPP